MLDPTANVHPPCACPMLNWARANNPPPLLARPIPGRPQMGLGKTAQSTSCLQTLRKVGGVPGPFLIVAPLTTLGHWQREVQTWTDMVRVPAWRRRGVAWRGVAWRHGFRHGLAGLDWTHS